MSPEIFGLLVIAIPLLILGLLVFWNRYRTVFWVYVGAIAMVLGYLSVQGALTDIGKPVHDVVYGSVSPQPAGTKKMDATSESVSDSKPMMDKKPMATGNASGSKVGSPAGRYVDAPAN